MKIGKEIGKNARLWSDETGFFGECLNYFRHDQFSLDYQFSQTFRWNSVENCQSPRTSSETNLICNFTALQQFEHSCNVRQFHQAEFAVTNNTNTRQNRSNL